MFQLLDLRVPDETRSMHENNKNVCFFPQKFNKGSMHDGVADLHLRPVCSSTKYFRNIWVLDDLLLRSYLGLSYLVETCAWLSQFQS